MLSCSCLYVLEQGENSQLCAMICTLDKTKIQRDMKKPAGCVCHFAKNKSIFCVFVQGRRSGCYPFIRISSLCIIKHTHARTHTDIHTNTHACIYFYMRAREARKRDYTHARASMYKYIYMHIHPYMHTNADTHTYMHIHI